MSELKKSLLIDGFAAATMAGVAGVSISHGQFYLAGLAGLTAVFEVYVAQKSVGYYRNLEKLQKESPSI